MTKDDRACALILLGIAIAACLGAFQHEIGAFDNPGPGFFPLVLGAVLGVLSITILIGGIMAKRAVSGQSAVTAGGLRRISKEALYILAALAAYGLLLVPLGFILTTMVVFAGLFRMVSELKWPIVLGGALVLALLAHFIFATLLGVSLPRGILAF